MSHLLRAAFVAALSSLVACGAPPGDPNPIDEGPADIGSGDDPLRRPFADDYAQYQTASNDRIKFEVSVIKSGNLRELTDRPLNDLLGVPDEWIRMQQRGTDIIDVRREARGGEEDEWSKPVMLSTFDELGRPVEQGAYKLLSVRVRLDGVDSTHKALQVCWASQRYCLMMDPVVQQLSTFADSRRELVIQGWKPQVEGAEAPPPDGVSTMAVCTLNSHPTWYGIKITYSSYTVKYKNVFGVTLVSKTLGGQQAGVSCYVSSGACRSSGFGYSNTSSCYGTLGYSCACKNTGNQNGSTQPSTRSWSETKCTHKLLGSASVSWTKSGVGSGFSINWDTNGGVDSNGGTLYDACSYH